MDIEALLDEVLQGGVTGAAVTLDALAKVNSEGRPTRTARAAPKEWPPQCATGLCGYQGCLCRTRERAAPVLMASDAEAAFDLEAELKEFGSMLFKEPNPPSVSPARTESGRRGRGRPPKKPPVPKFNDALTPPRVRPPPGARPLPSLVQEAALSLRDEAGNKHGRKMVRDLDTLFRAPKMKRVAQTVLDDSMEGLLCEETLDHCPYSALLCYETLSPCSLPAN